MNPRYRLYVHKVDEPAFNFAEEIPIPFGGWDIFVGASRAGTLKILAEAILESTRVWKTIGIHFVSELSEAPCLGRDQRDKLLKALGSIARDT
ncbi:hypothetical protein E6H36_06460 [Candidatus Bathyarchaeota archaeon]|nr:MAG: hypothetical protein E6H36_06460 [Candidatus Bathyarchaeota archaeon]